VEVFAYKGRRFVGTYMIRTYQPTDIYASESKSNMTPSRCILFLVLTFSTHPECDAKAGLVFVSETRLAHGMWLMRRHRLLAWSQIPTTGSDTWNWIQPCHTLNGPRLLRLWRPCDIAKVWFGPKVNAAFDAHWGIIRQDGGRNPKSVITACRHLVPSDLSFEDCLPV